MSRVLIIDDDVDFILKVQKMMPQRTEWLASSDMAHIEELVQQQEFDYIVARKKFEPLIKDIVQAAVKNKNQKYHHPFHRVIILPEVLWRNRLRNALGRDVFIRRIEGVPVFF